MVFTIFEMQKLLISFLDLQKMYMMSQLCKYTVHCTLYSVHLCSTYTQYIILYTLHKIGDYDELLMQKLHNTTINYTASLF